MAQNLNKYQSLIEKKKNLSDEEQVFEAGKLIRDIEMVDVDQAYRKVQQKVYSKGRILKIYTSISRYAAILILPLLFFAIWSIEKPNQEITEQEITCPLGLRSQITLPDGSHIWLNSGSTIKYSSPFVGKNRCVELEGQAFLNVTKNKKSPFSIQAGNVKVNVTGTQFDFKSYPDDRIAEVTLKEGSINLSLLSEGVETSHAKMKPGDHFIFNKNTKKAFISNKNIDRYILWKDNMLIFDETPMTEVKKILERWYGVDIEIKNKVVESYKFTTTFKNKSLSQVLELLELSSPIKIDYLHARVNRKTKQVTNSKIIISQK